MISCEDAEIALDLYQQTFIPLILLDLALPGMDGFEFTRRIRALPQGDLTMILVITAFDRRKDIMLALDAGADDYLVKPVSVDQLQVRLTILERRLESLMRRKRAEEELEKHRHHLAELVNERTIKLQKEIEERKRKEEEVLLLKNAIETAKVGVTITDANRKILYTNLAEAETHGYTREELVNKDVRIFSPEEYWQNINFDQLDHHWERESVNIRKDGSTFPVHSISTPVRDESGNPIGIITISEDITERKQAEMELKNAKDAAEAANRVKSEFLANMSHEIRTPMNAVLGFSEILKEQLRDFPEYGEYLNGIVNSGNNLLRLINDILDLSKIEAGRLEIRPETVHLKTIFDEIQSIFSLKTREKGVQLQTHIDANIPAIVLIDGTRLRQILFNLVGNAVKFTHKGSISVLLTTVVKERAESKTLDLLVEVRDTGIGIPPEIRQRIFELFHQQNPQYFGGTGLGLTIARRLVVMMNGTISVESTVDEGTVFQVSLPGVSVVNAEEVIIEEKETFDMPIHFNGATILLVEDNASNKDVVRTYVSPYNLRLIEAENGQEAIRVLKQTRPDLILMDIQMPVMDGDEVTKIIKGDQNLREIPVVALTAYAMKEQREQFQELFDAYLSKPIFKAELIATFAKFLPHTTLSAKEEGEIAQYAVTDTLPGEHGASAFPGIEQRGILEDLETYSAHTETFPKEFLDTFHDDLLPKYREISEVMSIDEIIEFAEALIAAGGSFTIPPLKKYGDELLRRIKVFDITNVKHLLTQFSNIVEIIRGKEL